MPSCNHIKPRLYMDLKHKMVPKLESHLDCLSGKTSAQTDVGPFSVKVVAGDGVMNPLTVMGTSYVRVQGSCSIAMEC